jgi:hypothetical protein
MNDSSTLCRGCQYIGDKYSFPQPNDLTGADASGKHWYCCCGDCVLYSKDVTALHITECECFEAL